MYLGDYNLSAIIDFKFPTRNTSGAPTTLSGTPAVKVYKTNSTTETATGVTLTVDFDSVTGQNHVRIDLSSDGTFYAAACDFQVQITAGTVGGGSVVGETVAHFSILNRSPLRPATAGRTLVVDSNGLADANMVKAGPSGSGAAQTAGDIIGDTNDIQARLPAALTANGNIKSSLVEILTTALTETPGQIAAAFKKFFDKATPTGTINSLPDAVAGAANGVAIVGSQMDLKDAPNATALTAIGTAVWAILGSAMSGATSIGKMLADFLGVYTAARGAKLDNLDTNVGSRMATFTYTAPDNAGVSSAAASAAAAASSAATAATQATAAATSASSADSKLSAGVLTKINGSAQEAAATTNKQAILAAIDAIDPGSGGDGGGDVQIIIAPITGQAAAAGQVVDGTAIHAYHNCLVEVGPFAVFDANGDAVDLTLYFDDLALVVFAGTRPTERKVGELIDGNLIQDPDLGNQFTIDNSQLLTTKIGEFTYQLTRRTPGEAVVRLQGDFIVHPRATPTAPP